MKRLALILVIVTAIGSAPLAAAAEICSEPGRSEEVLYTWRLRGALAWIAGIAFPTSGTAELTTTRNASTSRIDTDLLIKGPGSRPDYYSYGSEIETNTIRTVMSSHAYSWGKKEKEERTLLDYRRQIRTTVKKSSKTDEVRTKTESIPARDLRDILTGIYYLRVHADAIVEPIATEIYSDGKLYPVMYQPLGTMKRKIGGRLVETVGFEISARPGDENKWPGGVEVWVTTDARALPVKIVINQTFASMELDVASAACGADRLLLSRK